ncbi:MAG: hypothetical protein NTZ20_02915 [Candidatus Levybacteria bacterium]|nr:hypothetical protein [Candidatus Levybacteria bacterium]
MQYLQDDQHYIDRYDLRTIEECLDWYWSIREDFNKKRDDGELKKFTKEEFGKEVHKIASYTVNVIKAQRYKQKKETIQKWIDRDSKEQKKFDNAVAPGGVLCKECFSPTKVTSKDLLDSYEPDSQILFMFECLKCKKRQALYEDGTEWHHEDPKCPECNSPLNDKSKNVKNVLTTTYSCSNCDYIKEDIYDFNKSKKEREAREARESKLLTEYRKEFCVDEKVGEEMLLTYEQISRLVDEMKENEKKDKDPQIQKARQLKKLTVVRLGKLITDTIEKEGYTDLKFGKPEMGQHVIIDFSVNEAKEERKEYDSQNTLKKIIKEILEDTNWRLMSDGIHYRLGILTGRLKAFEREQELVELVR